MKRLICLILSLCFIFATVVSCGKNGSAESSSSEKQDEPEKQIHDEVEDVKGKFIVKNENTDYKIVINANYNLTELFAAEELQDYLNKSSNVEMQIITDDSVVLNSESKYLIIGNTKFTQDKIDYDVSKLTSDSYIIKTVDNSIYFLGQNQAGTLYSVYEFLENTVGVKFITADYTYVPKKKDLPFVNYYVVSEPYVERRYYMGGNQTTDSANESLYLAHCRMASNYGSNSMYGSECEWCISAGMSHNITTNYVLPEEWENTHPEFFAVRTASNKSLPKDICWTNGLTDSGEVDKTKETSVFTVVLNKLKTYVMESNENIKYFMFGHNDIGRGNLGCQCSRCKAVQEKYGYSGMQLRFVNKLAEEINTWAKEELDREIYIVCWAYGISENAPTKEVSSGKYVPIDSSVVANDNVVIYYAPIHANRYYGLLDEKQIDNQKNNVKQWRSVASKFVVWTYEVDFKNYMVYLPRTQTYHDDVLLYNDMDVKYALLQADWDTMNLWNNLMQKYVSSKMLWNPNQDAQALKEEWLTYYSGPAAKTVLEIVQTYEEIWFEIQSKRDKNEVIDYDSYAKDIAANYGKIIISFKNKLDSEILKIQNGVLDKTDKEMYIKHLESIKATFMFLELEDYDSYHNTSLTGRYDLAVEFFGLANRLGITKRNEGTDFSSIQYKYLG